jgi:hypothetical protein
MGLLLLAVIQQHGHRLQHLWFLHQLWPHRLLLLLLVLLQL